MAITSRSEGLLPRDHVVTPRRCGGDRRQRRNRGGWRAFRPALAIVYYRREGCFQKWNDEARRKGWVLAELLGWSNRWRALKKPLLLLLGQPGPSYTILDTPYSQRGPQHRRNYYSQHRLHPSSTNIHMKHYCSVPLATSCVFLHSLRLSSVCSTWRRCQRDSTTSEKNVLELLTFFFRCPKIMLLLLWQY